MKIPVVVLAAALTSCGPTPTKGTRGMIEYQAQPTRTHYSFGEEIEVRLVIRNQTGNAVKFADPSIEDSASPVFLLQGPGLGEKGVWLTASRKLDAPPSDTPPGPGSGLVEVEPGSTWSSIFSLSRVVRLDQAGKFRMRSRISVVPGAALSAQEATFELGPSLITSAHLGLGTRPLGSGEGRGAFLQKSGVFAFNFQEIRAGIGEASVSRPVHRCAAGESATDVSVPWKNSAMFDEMVDWILWREGRQVKLLSTVSSVPVSVDAPFELAHLIQPSLKESDGPLDSLALSADGIEIALLRVMAKGAEQPKTEWAWRAKLPARPLEIGAALGPKSTGNKRYVAMLSGTTGKYQVAYASFGTTGPLGEFHSAPLDEIGDMSPVAGALAVAEDVKGLVRVISLFHQSNRKEIALVETVFGSGMKPVVKKLQGSWQKGDVKSGVLLAIVDPAGMLARVEGLVVLGDGALLRLHMASGVATPSAIGGTLTNPILVAPGETGFYAIFHDPSRGLYAERQ